MATRLYVVEDRVEKKERLVRSTYRLMARRHAAAQRFSARIASKDDIERMLTQGVMPEVADEKKLASEAQEDALSEA